MINSNEKIIDKLVLDLYNKKVIVKGNDDTTIIFKCASINEMIELKQECARILKTENFIYR
jgi:hypothetical protein